MMINVGCGGTFHADWINLDAASSDPNVRIIDITRGLPFADGSASVCYSSHVLEHLDKNAARVLVAECYRVLKPGAPIRIVVPDLESIMREYLRILETVTAGDASIAPDYEWIMLELLDQVVRDKPGGEMTKFLQNLKIADRDFVRSRIGVEAEVFWRPLKVRQLEGNMVAQLTKLGFRNLIQYTRLRLAGALLYLVGGKAAYAGFKRGLFRASGEVHLWMYDRYSVTKLLESAGFVEVKVCSASESRIYDFNKYSLDMVDDIVRKPDSLFVEASKP
jgi:predicted SAM-dependent methyltransferase